MRGRLAPTHLGLGDFAPSKGRAGRLFHRHLVARLNLGKDFVGDREIALFQRRPCGGQPIPANLIARAFQQQLQLGDLGLRLGQGRIRIGDLALQLGNLRAQHVGCLPVGLGQLLLQLRFQCAPNADEVGHRQPGAVFCVGRKPLNRRLIQRNRFRTFELSQQRTKRLEDHFRNNRNDRGNHAH